jgi:hypothetical protein
VSGIPSDIAASAAQAGLQAREVTKDREAQRLGQAHAAARQVKTAHDADTTVETTDADTAVFADAEGQGGQGRELDGQPPADPDDVSSAGRTGITTDETGRQHVDLQA